MKCISPAGAEFFVGMRSIRRAVVGPPGTGKTMLAKAAAGVDDITFSTRDNDNSTVASRETGAMFIPHGAALFTPLCSR